MPHSATRSTGAALLAGAAFLALVALVGGSQSACRRSESGAAPLATPSVSLNHDRVSQGSPLEITYKFAVASDAKFPEDTAQDAHRTP